MPSSLSMIGARCGGLLRRYAVGCSEFRGLRKCNDCQAYYCWRHLTDHVCFGPTSQGGRYG